MFDIKHNRFKYLISLVVIVGVILLVVFLGTRQGTITVIPQLESLPVSYLTGSILNIEDNTLTLFVPEIMGVKVPANFKFIMRKVIVGPATSIVVRSPAKTLALADLKIGDTVSVSAGGYPDLKYEETVVAAEIIRNSD